MERLPLMTQFTPPTDCLASLTLSGAYSYLYLGVNSTCRPSGYSISSYYSPATVCPNGWTTAGSEVVTAGDVFETRASCCPRLGNLVSFTGESKMYTYSYYGICTAWAWGQISAQTLSYSGSSILQYGTSVYTTATALPVLIAYQESDLRTRASTSSTSVTSTSPSPTSPTVTSTSSPSPTSSSSPSGLSTTAKISMGVVIPVVVIVALVLVFFIMRRRKNKNKVPRREIQQEYLQGGALNTLESTSDQKYSSPPMSSPYQSQGRQSEYGDPSRWSQSGYGPSHSLMGSTLAPGSPEYSHSDMRSHR